MVDSCSYEAKLVLMFWIWLNLKVNQLKVWMLTVRPLFITLACVYVSFLFPEYR